MQTLIVHERAQLYTLSALLAQDPIDPDTLRLDVLKEHARYGAVELIAVAMRRCQRYSINEVWFHLTYGWQPYRLSHCSNVSNPKSRPWTAKPEIFRLILASVAV
ncbi:MAG TPA: hypothetical protein VEI29_05815 [Burkholderiaceae bacterium]|nr:hypothetical protein [Burkholderiaceae bacterium]